MKLVVLGSGGSQPTPKVGCDCRTCQAARFELRRDPRSRHVRTGPSLWLPEYGILIDTPEESNAQLNLHADGALNLAHVLWSHFHPDHTAGVRIVEFIARWGQGSLGSGGVPTHLPEDLETSLLELNLFQFAVQRHHLEVHRVQDREPFELGDLSVTMLRHSGEMPMYSFLLEDAHSRFLYNPDHVMTLNLTGPEPGLLHNLDCAIVQVGLMPDGAQAFILPPDHPARKVLLPLETICERAANLGWKKLCFTHLYESIRLFPEEYDALGQKLSDQFGLEVGFCFDGMTLELGQKIDSVSSLSSEELLARLHAKREAISNQHAQDRPRMRTEMRALMNSAEQLELDARQG
jgi:phosphoribosyl 1,2-cyclic phosphate phosphodiesterase